jgi:hypothetical protein
LGLDCVVNSSLMVLPECFRFSAPGLADIGRTWGKTRKVMSCGARYVKAAAMAVTRSTFPFRAH